MLCERTLRVRSGATDASVCVSALCVLCVQAVGVARPVLARMCAHPMCPASLLVNTQGGMFELVSGANFFGEIVEWSGWALAAGTLPAAAFAAFTFMNIAPRAVQHHANYQDRWVCMWMGVDLWG